MPKKNKQARILKQLTKLMVDLTKCKDAKEVEQLLILTADQIANHNTIQA